MSNKKKLKNWDVIIVGAGASGMVAGITAARRGKSVLILEHMDKPGKKIFATGNGKCNYTNAVMSADCYYGNRELVQAVLEQFGRDDALAFFREIGIFPKEKNGYYYPNSQQASSMVEALCAEISRLGITLFTACKVQAIEAGKFGFDIITTTGSYWGRQVIVATGLRAAPKLGSDGSILGVLKKMGHRFVPILPALCGFEATGMPFRKVSGVRADVRLSLWVDGKQMKEERGELQLADYGISGIPVFQLSSPAVRGLYDQKRVVVSIDFFPDLRISDLQEELSRRFLRDKNRRTLEQSLCGLLNHKLIPVFLQKAGYSSGQDAATADSVVIQKIAAVMHDYPVELQKVRDFSCAQVCTGGIRTEDIDIHTLGSKIVPGLYFAGELLDVDGICGGYNLQWAWASGFVAGNSIL